MLSKFHFSFLRTVSFFTWLGAPVLFLGCSSASDQTPAQSNAPVAQAPDSAGPTGTMKEGAGKVGEGIGDVARGAAQGLKETVCPIVGIRTSRVFYTKSDKGYDSVLKGEKTFSNKDNRECFVSAENASKAGYTRVGDQSAH